MSNFKQFAPAAYLIGFVLFLIPFFDAGTSVAPWHLAMPEWRFAAGGLMSNAFMLPAAGALIMAATALTFSHLRTQLWLGLFFWLLTLFVVLVMLSFTLDAVQTRNSIRPELHLSFQVAAITAEVKLFLAAVSFGLLARSLKVERWVQRWVDGWLKKKTASTRR